MRRREFLRLGAAGLLATTLSALPVSFPVPPTHGGPTEKNSSIAYVVI